MPDLEALLELESSCFDPARRDPRSTIRRSLSHPHHEVWLLEGPGGHITASLFLRHVRKALRIYSLATHPSLRGQGWGNLLLEWAFTRCLALGKSRVVLEADASNPDLLAWYERHGFQRVRLLPSYYAPSRHAWRFERNLAPSRAV